MGYEFCVEMRQKIKVIKKTKNKKKKKKKTKEIKMYKNCVTSPNSEVTRTRHDEFISEYMGNNLRISMSRCLVYFMYVLI